MRGEAVAPGTLEYLLRARLAGAWAKKYGAPYHYHIPRGFQEVDAGFRMGASDEEEQTAGQACRPRLDERPGGRLQACISGYPMTGASAGVGRSHPFGSPSINNPLLPS